MSLNINLTLNSFRGGDGKLDVGVLIMIVLLLLTITASDLSQLVFVLIGAAAYAMAQAVHVPAKRLGTCRAAPGPSAGKQAPKAFKPSAVDRRLGPNKTASAPGVASAPVAPGLRQPSSRPVAAPSFEAVGWDAEVTELVQRIAPTAEGDRAVQRLALMVQQTLRRTIPEVEVIAFASGGLCRGTAFGVAVPEVDIVVSVSPNVLAARLQNRFGHRSMGSDPPGGGGWSSTAARRLDARKLQKSAIRTFTDALVSAGGFKFRRSAFRGQEPKVTLLAPPLPGLSSDAIPVDFGVNNTGPLHNAALLLELGRLEIRARDLILLVKRWAKDRGICHAAKGHLSPYCWTLLAIYFLQVRPGNDGGPLLSELAGFQLASSLAAGTTKPIDDRAAPTPAPQPPRSRGPLGRARTEDKTTVGALFKEFVRFYKRTFDWRKEAVSLRLGVRSPPRKLLPIHIMVFDDGVTTEAAPNIEDPFDPTRNLGEGVSEDGFRRLHAEFARAEALFGAPDGGSLSRLLEPWAPPAAPSSGEAPFEATED
mmetsp:Transcript_24979/g.83355  ORF Transcript_24979/g.83355 Transcript_24979/m.83355 type:complete len:536 (-) Transcript_24979:83-1690(-)